MQIRLDEKTGQLKAARRLKDHYKKETIKVRREKSELVSQQQMDVDNIEQQTQKTSTTIADLEREKRNTNSHTHKLHVNFSDCVFVATIFEGDNICLLQEAFHLFLAICILSLPKFYLILQLSNLYNDFLVQLLQIYAVGDTECGSFSPEGGNTFRRR
jgi:hypothetical protein